MDNTIFMNIAIVIIFATVLAFFFRLLKQPKIPAYILAGILIGPFGFKIITDLKNIITISEIGIAFLLFVVGLELEFKKLKNVGLVSTVGGTTRMLIMFTSAFLLALVLGFFYLEAVYIAIAVAFSSTMVIVKILSDRHELETLRARIVIGILVMEDIAAILALSILTTLNYFTPMVLLVSLLKAGLIIGLAIFCSRFVFHHIFKIAAKSSEMLFLVSLTICFFFALMSGYFGFSIAIGAFIAGVALANLPYNYEIIGKIGPLKDFFATLFFTSLGMEISINSFVNGPLKNLLIILAFLFITKPFITMFLVSFFGYTKKTSFLCATSLAQTSEFSLIIAAQGLILGHISQNVFSMIIAFAIVTISITPYLIKYEAAMFKIFSPYIAFLDKFGGDLREMDFKPKKYKYNAVLIGYDRIGYNILSSLRKLKKKLLVVDYNPEIIRNLLKKRVNCLYGDIEDPDILERIDFKKANIVISTAPTTKANLVMLKKIKKDSPSTLTFVTAYNVDDALKLYDEGADYVILPHFLGGDRISLMLEEISFDLKKMLQTKVSHIKELKRRVRLGHRHPRREHR